MNNAKNFYIDGKWVAPAKVRDMAVIDPSTEEVCETISLGDQADTDAAVAAARRAFEPWASSDPAERIALAEKVLEIYTARSEEMAQAISLEMGAPQDLARAQQVGAGSWHLEGFLRA
ncbi:MAG: aldehyde dehydrogenase family protein, partial [Roseicyclus sp.]|nr:aldehyde dehydrogenase family protein [Roseicyclus sp.]